MVCLLEMPQALLDPPEGAQANTRPQERRQLVHFYLVYFGFTVATHIDHPKFNLDGYTNKEIVEFRTRRKVKWLYFSFYLILEPTFCSTGSEKYIYLYFSSGKSSSLTSSSCSAKNIRNLRKLKNYTVQSHFITKKETKMKPGEFQWVGQSHTAGRTWTGTRCSDPRKHFPTPLNMFLSYF